MTNADLMELVGKEVTILLKDGDVATGILEYIPEFSSKYGFRKPKMYSIQDKFKGVTWSFKVSHVKRVDYWLDLKGV